MAKETYYAAIDVGTNKVSSILARVGSEGELKILGTGISPCYGVQKGRVESIEEVKSAVASALGEAQRYVGRGVISSVYASISGNHITCMNTKDTLRNSEYVDGLTAQHLSELMKASLPDIDSSKEILHVIPIGYEVDGLSGVRNPFGLHANDVQVESHVVTGDATIIKNTVKTIEACKVNVNSLVSVSYTHLTLPTTPYV